ncbi:tyrosine-type recombinase/integrase [Sphingobium sp. AN641]|uniref:tyrosine-type recombinase/integrase n=1 Tax=Sphingobium sp. AN641 TaxID=3133443 RepID=UPI0030BA8584
MFDSNGQRKYLTQSESQCLLALSNKEDRQTRMFCHLLYYTGCRCSEGLQITPRRLDLETGRIIFRTLKRRRTVFRAVPVPRPFLRELKAFAASLGLGPDDPLFPWCRQTAWRHIRKLMHRAGIEGPQATPKGFRHGFGCHGVGSGLPESLVGRLLGHANPNSTRIYTLVRDDEERALARRMWQLAL